ncbi:MAG: ZIP family metal transporter, partial [Chloroflexi bacterium]|nr:ZIP family metal transporter [Chloroflexota bacterium]
LISFAAGVLVAAAFTELIPESLELNDAAVPGLLLSFLAFYLVERYVLIHTHHHEHEHGGETFAHTHAVGIIAFVGLTLHSLLDGIIISAGFEVNLELGMIAALGVIAHEIPEGFSIASILLYDGFTRVRTLIYSTIVALATPAGALLAFFLLEDVSTGMLGFLLAVAAGSFLYIAASDLIPETHQSHSAVTVFLVLAGAALIVGAGAILG